MINDDSFKQFHQNSSTKSFDFCKKVFVKKVGIIDFSLWKMILVMKNDISQRKILKSMMIKFDENRR
jgi:hypothetical protein